ncbi:hypothetical protein O9K51_04755 [Purpureocillium lavendulum]|uniref:Antifungal protein n=1 Tax=Purpureocillium lavendulum TaxID=1247861 RepID=A0AB34FZ03_9HYPO|nr:hypothetical protein O9K51_04755 [Purpureocillium lavendulum]
MRVVALLSALALANLANASVMSKSQATKRAQQKNTDDRDTRSGVCNIDKQVCVVLIYKFQEAKEKGNWTYSKKNETFACPPSHQCARAKKVSEGGYCKVNDINGKPEVECGSGRF